MPHRKCNNVWHDSGQQYAINNDGVLSVGFPDLPYKDNMEAFSYIKALFKAVLVDIYTFPTTRYHKCNLSRGFELDLIYDRAPQIYLTTIPNLRDPPVLGLNQPFTSPPLPFVTIPNTTTPPPLLPQPDPSAAQSRVKLHKILANLVAHPASTILTAKASRFTPAENNNAQVDNLEGVIYERAGTSLRDKSTSTRINVEKCEQTESFSEILSHPLPQDLPMSELLNIVRSNGLDNPRAAEVRAFEESTLATMPEDMLPSQDSLMHTFGVNLG